MDQWTHLAPTIESLATSAAIILGGLWTYRAFFRQRLSQPRLTTTISTKVLVIPTGRLVRCNVIMENRGGVVVKSRFGEIRCRQVLPLPTDVQDAAAQGFDPVAEGSTGIEWPLLAGRKWSWRPGEFEIEPGEADYLYTEFFIPSDPLALEIYFFLDNAKKRKKNLGWHSTTIVDLTPQEAPMAKEAPKTSKPQNRPLQQRPKESQRQQQPQQTQKQQQKQQQNKDSSKK